MQNQFNQNQEPQMPQDYPNQTWSSSSSQSNFETFNQPFSSPYGQVPFGGAGPVSKLPATLAIVSGSLSFFMMLAMILELAFSDNVSDGLIGASLLVYLFVIFPGSVIMTIVGLVIASRHSKMGIASYTTSKVFNSIILSLNVIFFLMMIALIIIGLSME